MNGIQRLVSKAVNAVLGTMSQDVAAGERGSPDLPEKMKEAARRAAAQGIVLLKNDDGALPLAQGESVSVFGRVQLDYFAVGYGSGGDVNAPYTVNLIDGLAASGVVNVDSELAETYKKWVEANPADHGFWGMWPFSHDEMPLDENTVRAAAERSKKAVVVIGRAAGEDRENKLKKGSYYLTDAEENMLDKVCAAFRDVIVLLNCGSIMDTSWFDKYDSLKAALYVWQGGMESGNAVADVLTGKVNPCGRLTDTVAYEYSDYPGSENFNNRKFNNYAEDIYVGYRYFETFSPDRVQFPFGFGLSYTQFETQVRSLECTELQIKAHITVKNAGAYTGREVIQIYYGAPQGTLGKAERSLAAYAKTSALAPGESEDIILRFPTSQMASFDDSGKSGRRGVYVLEAGEYPIYIGENVRSAGKCGAYVCEAARVISEHPSPVDFSVKEPFKRLVCICERGRNEKTREVTPKQAVSRAENILSSLPEAPDYSADKGIKLADVAAGKATVEEFAAQLSNEELEALCRGDYTMNSPLGTSGNAAVYGGILPSLREKGVPPVTATDGPSGIRLHCYASLLPIGTALACTWDTEMVEELYNNLGAEMAQKGSDVLLAPGMNIHRDPLCGRNFEYFSEDPLMSGTMAAAVVRGLQKNGVSACPKHFACNNQETNRVRNDSRVSERALREIYLKGFEICIKEARPQNIMTSYNKINGVWAHYHYGLCTELLRGEWGFDGCVMTDWWMRASKDPDFPRLRNNAYRVRAQVDVLMPGAGAGSRSRKYDSTLLETLDSQGGITRGEIFRSAVNTLKFVMKSHPFITENNLGTNGYTPGERWFSCEKK